MSDIKNTPAHTPPIHSENSIASLETVTLGNSTQWVLLRGYSSELPVLLFLHGGPGVSEMPLVRHYLSDLEKDFLVVNWDQRGAGKSYPAIANKQDMNINRFIEDTRELAEILIKRFNKKKIYILGHSWGTALGILSTQRYPNLFHAYGAIGQVVNLEENERLSYEFTRREAFKRGDRKAIHQLKQIGFPPYRQPDGSFDREKMGIQRQWLGRFGGSVFGNKGFEEMESIIADCVEYTDEDRAHLRDGAHRSFELMREEYEKLNLLYDAPELEIPIYFFTGRHDYQTPHELSHRYFEKLEAPAKEFIWFEKSCHAPCYEEPDRFMEILREKFRHHL